MKNYPWKFLGIMLVVIIVVGIGLQYLPEGVTIEPEVSLGLMILFCWLYVTMIDKRLKRVEKQCGINKEE